MMNEHQTKKQSAAIIGAGISGLSCAKQLKKLGFQVELFEKSRGVSGRMSTRKAVDWSADHGAQYFTARDPLFINELDEWIDANVAALWKPRLKVFKDNQWIDCFSAENRYVGTPDMNSPGKYLAKDLSIKLNQTIDRIAYDHDQWHLHSLEAGDIERQYDWLILALPAQQSMALAQSIDKSIEIFATNANMQGCWTVIASFAESLNLPFDAAFINNEIISWICRNNSKPNRSGQETWIIHANPQWSQEWIALDKDAAAKLILDSAMKLGLDGHKAKISIHRWLYASGHANPIPGFCLNADLKIGFCGDWLNGGRVEGAWLSGHKLATHIQSINY